MSVIRVRHRFSVDDYEQMVEYGILTEQNRVELIRGEIVDKMTIGDPHAACVNRLSRLFNKRVGDDVLVAVQNPIRLADSVPEPDIALLLARPDFYATGKPRPADVLLLIEVADSSLDYDREVKRPLYAESGIGEYWIVNLPDQSLEVYRAPAADGTYGSVQTLRRGQQIEVAALPGLIVTVDEML